MPKAWRLRLKESRIITRHRIAIKRGRPRLESIVIRLFFVITLSREIGLAARFHYHKLSLSRKWARFSSIPRHLTAPWLTILSATVRDEIVKDRIKDVRARDRNFNFFPSFNLFSPTLRAAQYLLIFFSPERSFFKKNRILWITNIFILCVGE